MAEMAVAAKQAPVEEEINPDHPQYQHGMEAGMKAAGALANLPRPVGPPNQIAPGMTQQTMAQPQFQSPGGALNGLPRTPPVSANALANPPQTLGPTPAVPMANTAPSSGPAVGGTVAVPTLGGLPRKRNTTAVMADPKDFFRRQ